MDSIARLKKLPVEDQLELVLEHAEDSEIALNYVEKRKLKRIPGIKYIAHLEVDDIKGVISSSVVIPITDILGKVQGVELRSVSDYNDIRYSKILLDEMVIYNFPNKHHNSTVIITEGVIDCLTLYEEGLNVVSALRAKVPKDTLHFLASIFDRIVVIFDNDESGEAGTKDLVKFYKRYYKGVVKTSVIRVPDEYKDINEFKQKAKPKRFKKWVKEVVWVKVSQNQLKRI